MADLHEILNAIPQMSAADQLAILNVLNGNPATQPAAGANRDAVPLVGLLADEPDLADAILHSAMSAREYRPLRTNGG